MSNYIKKYNLGNIMVDLPYDSYIHELPLLSFSDYRNSVNISLVFNKRLQSIDTAACTNTFNIKEGFKLNIQKKVYLDDNDLKYKYIDSSGKVITLINNGGVYTFDDDSKRILKVISSGYIVENYDFSKEEFNNNGLLLNVYDKYGDLYLAYTYNSSNLLTSVTYNGKSVMFSYESNVLNEISYDETTTKITCVDNILIVEHYNLAVYVCSITGNDYVVEAKPSKNSVTEYMKSCTFENNTIQLIEKIGTEIMDYIKYTFPQNVTGNYKYYKQVEITNFLGAKQRIQFKDKKVLYSYVIDPDASFSENRIYEGNVTINMIDNEIDDFKFNGTLRYNDGLQMRYDLSNPNVWYCDRSSFNNYNGKYLVTGWVKSSDSLMATINISNILGVEQDTYNIPLNALNQWHFFAFQFPFTGNYMYISPTQSTVELSDVRLNYHSYEIYDQSINSNCLYYEDILFIGNQRVPFSEISFSYTKNGQRFNIENITLSDLLKYKLELIKAVNNNLLYYKDSKNVINGIQT